MSLPIYILLNFAILFHPVHLTGLLGQYFALSVSLYVCVCHTFFNAPTSPEEDEEKEIYCSSRGEGQFISDLWEGEFPRDQVTTVEEKEDVEKEFILHITSEARLSLSSTAYNT